MYSHEVSPAAKLCVTALVGEPGRLMILRSVSRKGDPGYVEVRAKFLTAGTTWRKGDANIANEIQCWKL